MQNKKVVCFGEILWDNLIEGRRLGGAPLNVCYHLMKMGISSTIITQVGNDQNGKQILAELDLLQIDKTYCHTSIELPTSTVEVHLSGNGNINYEIVENVAWDEISITPEIESLVKESNAFVFGSLITRSDVSRKSLYRLIENSRYRVFDVNLRTPYYDKSIICSLLEKTNLLKLNDEELIIISKWLGVTNNEDLLQMENIQDNYPNIEGIILTKGAEGAIYYAKGIQSSVKALKVNVKDTVGSGDSFLAAFLSAKLKGLSIEYALQSASLLSGFIASQPGACPGYKLSDLVDFKESLHISRIN